jgi:subtilisin family serine protease
VPQSDAWNARVLAQVKEIQNAFSTAPNPITIEAVRDNDGGVAYMYAESEILVHEDSLKDVRDILQPSQHTPGPERVVKGVLRHSLTGTRFSAVNDALNEIDAQRGRIVATPNHVLTVAGVAGPCPATDPEQVYDGTEPFPAAQSTGGAGVLIYIADTGLLEGTDSTFPWLGGVRRAVKSPGQSSQGVGDPVEQDYDALVPPAGGARRGKDAEPLIKPYTGHGTFVAGVARCVAPQADVIVSNVFKVAGSALESDFIQELDEALDLGVDIFNLSVTVPTRNNRPMLAFQRWLARASEYKGVVCVAAAGNSGQRIPNWPAAFPQVVSVGALAADWRSRAQFSNYGGWVDVYAPGRDIINAFATGKYVCYDVPYVGEERQFYGMAQWSGTSFSTPIVTGLIAARMSHTGENGQEAAAALLAEARTQAIPGVGAILLPYGNKSGG